MSSDLSQTSKTLLDWLRDPSNRTAWGAFAERYGERIRGWCRRRGLQEADADEVCQQLLAEIHDRLKGFEYDPARGRFRDWLRTVTRHACDNFLARAPSQRFRELFEDLPAREDLEAEIDRQARHEVLEDAMVRVRALVSARDWRIFVRLAFEGRPGAEVATDEGMKVTAAYMVKHRVVERLRQEIRRIGGEAEDGELQEGPLSK
jgi:RNA polymerase sigma-70 factor (ECF subfamily)